MMKNKRFNQFKYNKNLKKLNIIYWDIKSLYYILLFSKNLSIKLKSLYGLIYLKGLSFYLKG